jgi:hypothetical protein
MPDRLIRLHASIRIPTQASCKEIKESFIIAFQDLLESLRGWFAATPLGGDCETRLPKGIKEQLFAGTLFDQMFLWRPKDLHDACQLLLLILPWKYRISCK